MMPIGIADTPGQTLGQDHQGSDPAVLGRSYLGVGLYSMSEVARLARMPAATVRRWAGAGRSPAQRRRSSTKPLIRREDPELITRGLFTFKELIELLLVRRLREAGVPLSGIHSIIEQAALALQTSHPLVTRGFYTARPLRREPNGIPTSTPFEAEIRSALEALASQLDYAEDDTVSGYWPLGKGRRVVLEPARALGQPVDPASGVPTRALAGMSAAGEPIEEVALWYRVDPEAVRDAIEFEQSLTAGRLPRAA